MPPALPGAMPIPNFPAARGEGSAASVGAGSDHLSTTCPAARVDRLRLVVGVAAEVVEPVQNASDEFVQSLLPVISRLRRTAAGQVLWHELLEEWQFLVRRYRP